VLAEELQLAGPIDANGKALIGGNPLPQAPKSTINFTLKYTQPAGAGEWYVLTDWVYRSKVNFFLYESKEFTGKALTEGGPRVGYVGATASTKPPCSAATSRTRSASSAASTSTT
jgi:hypothetical protein